MILAKKFITLNTKRVSPNSLVGVDLRSHNQWHYPQEQSYDKCDGNDTPIVNVKGLVVLAALFQPTRVKTQNVTRGGKLQVPLQSPAKKMRTPFFYGLPEKASIHDFSI